MTHVEMGIQVDLTVVDWEVLGMHLGRQNSRAQSDFLVALAWRLGTLEDDALQEQMRAIVAVTNPRQLSRLEFVLAGLLEQVHHRQQVRSEMPASGS